MNHEQKDKEEAVKLVWKQVRDLLAEVETHPLILVACIHVSPNEASENAVVTILADRSDECSMGLHGVVRQYLIDNGHISDPSKEAPIQ